jgi:hypothetical protein
MTTYPNLCDPTHLVDADFRPVPRGSAFKKCDAHRLCPDDLVLVGKEVFRVKTKQLDATSRNIIFCLWPLKGGKVKVVRYAPRRQITAVLQDTEGRTKPLPAIL